MDKEYRSIHLELPLEIMDKVLKEKTERHERSMVSTITRIVVDYFNKKKN